MKTKLKVVNCIRVQHPQFGIVISIETHIKITTLIFIKETTLSLVFFQIVVQVQLSPFSTHHSLWPQPSSPPTLDPDPPWLCLCVLCICSFTTLPSSLYPHYPLPLRGLIMCINTRLTIDYIGSLNLLNWTFTRNFQIKF